MADEKLSGIKRAIAVFGTHVELAKEISKATNERVAPYSVGYWEAKGYVPGNRVPIVSRLTGVPETDLIRKDPRKIRSDKGIRKKTDPPHPGNPEADRFKWWSVKTTAGTE